MTAKERIDYALGGGVTTLLLMDGLTAAREALTLAKERLIALDMAGTKALRYSGSDAAFGTTAGVRDAIRELDQLLADLSDEAQP